MEHCKYVVLGFIIEFGGDLSPNMRKLDTTEHMNLCYNQIIGNNPSVIGAFESLRYLECQITHSKEEFHDLLDS